MTLEKERTQLIGEIARVLRDGTVPDEARAAALTLIGYLARRMPGECAHEAGVHLCVGARMRAGADHVRDSLPRSASSSRGRWSK